MNDNNKIPPIKGLKISAIEAGLRYKDRPDLMLALLDEGSQMAAVFTKSAITSASLEAAKSALSNSKGKARAILVNAGNANAFTGKAGDKIAQDSIKELAKICAINSDEIYLASTGVIGEIPDGQRIYNNLAPLYNQVKTGECDWQNAAKAIMTTDQYEKIAHRTAIIAGHEVKLVGMAKGAGMIAPNMATMLGFIFTDAKIPATILQEMLNDVVEKSFNAISVDSDCSTNDSVFLAATGASPHKDIIDINDADLNDFKKELLALSQELALMIVKDGEGATKLITVNINGAIHDVAAKKIGLSVINSPLVKTAIAGEDANWGRIVMAVGKSGEEVKQDRLSLSFGKGDKLIKIVEKGEIHKDFQQSISKLDEMMKQDEIIINLDLALASGQATVWGCDLTHDYITINADYRS